MNRLKSLLLCTFASSATLSAQLLNPAAPVAPRPAVAGTPAPTPAKATALVFDAETKDYHAKPGESSAPFTFHCTNVSSSEVLINRLSTSCGCTVAQLPNQPYKLAPGASVPISVSLDMRNKMGTVAKTVSVDSSAGFKSLLVRAHIPPATNNIAGHSPGGNNMGDRARNIQTALADRQAVFKGNCAECHVDKARGKMGQELYVAACGICHDAEHRAAMVPDLNVARTARDLAFWQKWIMEGKAGTMMPAFAAAHGGPLTQEQIDSLTIFSYQSFPKEPPAVAAKTPPAPRPAPAPVPLPPALKN